jgi:protein ImuA
MGAAISLFELGMSSRLQRQLWRGNQFSDADSGVVSSGHRKLDRVLPGAGWMTGVLTEVLVEDSGVGEMRLLARTLRELTTIKGRSAVFVAPPWKPFLTAFRAWGIETEKLFWVKAPDDQALWAAEQSLKQKGIGAVLIWLPKVRPEAVRRLQVAAQESQALAFLFRPIEAASQSSAAPLRMICRPVLPDDAQTMNRREWMQQVMLEIDIIKRRGPLLEKPLRLPLPLQMPALPEHVRRSRLGRPGKSGQKAREVNQVVDSGDFAAFIARSSQAAIDDDAGTELEFVWNAELVGPVDRR